MRPDNSSVFGTTIRNYFCTAIGHNPASSYSAVGIILALFHPNTSGYPALRSSAIQETGVGRIPTQFPLGCEQSDSWTDATTSSKNAPQPPMPHLSATQAKDLARAFLRNKSWASQYLHGAKDVIRVLDRASHWHVIFRHVHWRSNKPGNGIILINKKTGAASWRTPTSVSETY